MSHFKSARLRMTAWYVIIVAIVSASFSAIIYQSITGEIKRSFQMAEIRLRTQNDTLLPKQLALQLLDRDLERAERAVVIRLTIIDGIVILASGIAAYILAGKTLAPIEESLEEQKRFTSDAGHELKTPLTSLRTELEVAIRDKRLTLKDTRKLLASNLEDVISLQNLSENLMKLNRYSQSQNGQVFEKLNTKEIVGDALKKVLPMAKKRKIKVLKHVTDLDVLGERQSLIELFTILLDNAIKYSPENSSVTISSSKSRRKLIFEVRDRGVGIAKEDIPHLFDRFFRSDSSRNKTNAEGYGLGLAIAREIVERHKGEIFVKSKLAKGSTFTVTLPY